MSDSFPVPRLSLVKAFLLGATVTLMAVPWIRRGGMDLWMAVPVAFMAMVLISLAAVSWEHRAGMHGVFPEKGRMLIGMGLAGLTVLVLAWISTFWLDRVFESTMRQAGRTDLLALRYPDSPGGQAAKVLWAAGFETMFFQVGAVSFFSRLTDRQWLAIVGAVSFRGMVTSMQLSQAGLVDATWLFIMMSVATSAVACMLYVRAGLPAAMLFSAVLSLRAPSSLLWMD